MASKWERLGVCGYKDKTTPFFTVEERERLKKLKVGKSLMKKNLVYGRGRRDENETIIK